MPTTISSDTMVTLVRSSSATPTGLSTAAPQATNVNIALLGTAYASSASSISPATGVNDGVVGGLSGGLLFQTGNSRNEWVSTGGVNSWVQVNLTANYQIQKVVLYGRVNTAYSIQAGTLSFSDGTSVVVGAVDTVGTTVAITGGKTVSWVRFTATKISGSTVGLAEMQFFNAAVPVSDTTSAATSRCTPTLLNPFCL